MNSVTPSRLAQVRAGSARCARGLRVQPMRRLVQKQHRGPMEQPARDLQPPLHAPEKVLTRSSRRSHSSTMLEQLLARAARLDAGGTS